MATINQGILGGFSGKVGGVVGSSWKGIAVMKAKPQSVANPRTAAQVAQRSKMSFVVLVAQALLAAVIKPLWDRFSVKQSGYNSFIQSNVALFTTVVPSTPANFVISKGKMAATPITVANFDEGPDIVKVDWAVDSGEGYKLASDEAFVVVMNSVTGVCHVSAAGAIRSAGTVSCPYPSDLHGVNAHAYLAFRRADGYVVSNTSYSVVVA